MVLWYSNRYPSVELSAIKVDGSGKDKEPEKRRHAIKPVQIILEVETSNFDISTVPQGPLAWKCDQLDF